MNNFKSNGVTLHRKYYKYVYPEWTQPILTANNSSNEMIVSATNEGQAAAYKSFDESLDFGWCTSNYVTSSSFYCNFSSKKQLQSLSVTGISNQYGYTKTVTIYADNVLIGETKTFFTGLNSGFVTLTWSFNDLEVSNLEFKVTGYTWCSLKYISISANNIEVVEGTDEDYDYYTDSYIIPKLYINKSIKPSKILAKDDFTLLFESSVAGTYNISLKKQSLLKVLLVGGGGGGQGIGYKETNTHNNYCGKYTSTSNSGSSGAAFEGFVIVDAGDYSLVVGSQGYGETAGGDSSFTCVTCSGGSNISPAGIVTFKDITNCSVEAVLYKQNGIEGVSTVATTTITGVGQHVRGSSAPSTPSVSPIGMYGDGGYAAITADGLWNKTGPAGSMSTYGGNGFAKVELIATSSTRESLEQLARKIAFTGNTKCILQNNKYYLIKGDDQ